MVYQLTGEDDIDDSGNWRGPTAYSTYAEGSRSNFIALPSELGCTNDFVLREQERAVMVARMYATEECEINTKRWAQTFLVVSDSSDECESGQEEFMCMIACSPCMNTIYETYSCSFVDEIIRKLEKEKSK
ncbi:hypothetical protein BDC45DRAFT_538421 [Circinella umbellata]|nr:hypothetical protein BDC45DRAFT_538421 [Circinella umbellata]